MLAVAVMLSALFLSGCASGKWNRYELYMGQTYQDGQKQVSAQKWQDFLNLEVSPKFGDGYTVYDAKGYWAGEKLTYSERSKVLMIVSPDKDAEKRVDEIAKAYKKMFQQEAVLKVVNPVEVEFK